MDWKNEKLQSLWKMNKEKLIFLFCSGLLLFVISLPTDTGREREEKGMNAGEAVNLKEPEDTEDYGERLERRIEELLRGVEGVGEAEVMVVLKSSEERVLRVDQDSSTSVTEEKRENESRTVSEKQYSESTVLDGQSQLPIVEKELYPELSGIIISAEGGESEVVKAEISEAMEALFGLPQHKIKVLKRVKKGV